MPTATENLERRRTQVRGCGSRSKTATEACKLGLHVGTGPFECKGFAGAGPKGREVVPCGCSCHQAAS